jgi:mRNA-degrading endonuclease RelE of RelBE toxin-antitoxin system
MAKKLNISETFKECYKKLPRDIQKKVDRQLRFLVEKPGHPSLNVHLIERTGTIWKGYIDRSYRFTFEIREEEYFLRVVGGHKIYSSWH